MDRVETQMGPAGVSRPGHRRLSYLAPWPSPVGLQASAQRRLQRGRGLSVSLTDSLGLGKLYVCSKEQFN